MTLELYRELSQKAASTAGRVDFAVEVDGVLAGRAGLFAFDDLAHNADRCYAKAGFAEEGRLREHAWVDGAYDDMVRMAVLRSDWRR